MNDFEKMNRENINKDIKTKSISLTDKLYIYDNGTIIKVKPFQEFNCTIKRIDPDFAEDIVITHKNKVVIEFIADEIEIIKSPDN